MIGCATANEGSSSADDSKQKVYTTIYPFQYAVERIAGDTVDVETVFPPGADAHTYEPTSKDMTAVADSDLFIYLGAGMEGFAESMANSLANQPVKLLEIGKHEELFSSDGNHEDEEHEHGEESSDLGGTIEIEGLSDHYHSGDVVELTAIYNESGEEAHWHWYTLTSGEEEWVTVPDQETNHFEGEAIGEQQIKAALLGDDHQVIAESEAVIIEVNDHEGEAHEHEESSHEDENDVHDHGEETHNHGNEVQGTIDISGLAAHYHTGDTVRLTAGFSEDGDYDHWHWYTLEPGEKEWAPVEGQETNEYEGEATKDGLQVKVALFGDDEQVVAESEAVTLPVVDHGDHDPHIWLDPVRMIEVSQIIKDELIALNPDEEATYNNNFEELKAELTALDEKFTEVLADKKNMHIIVPHAAYGYWNGRYGIEQIAINGLSSSDEPSQRDLTEVIDKAAEYDLDYILYEQNSSNRLSEVIQKEIGAEALTVHNLEVLTDADVKNNEDYISLMEYNLEILDKVTK
ncbi:Mn2+/Zn2+ ABC transporter substrate-binding protein [Oceanobacillus arenosus]|uniref:Mn2+/Zn2+ ABC transporter substrate-binding protein n=2 Tax=Oceanobacillus arenosus TaxID=1229153 RepID=A0A3D8PQU0_9BACI|nr:Mn2+/Zn2+ ABC transporter substrate-binding protein [Oceanobacillus arenosus]